MPSEDTKMLEFNHYKKSDKAPICYLCGSCVFNRKIDRCKIIPEN